MENTSNADQQSPDQTFGNSTKGLSPQHNDIPANDESGDTAIYTGLGVNNQPDEWNSGDDEASDTVLHTDTATARHATDQVSNDAEEDEFPDDLQEDDLSDDEIDEQIIELAEEEDEGNERY